jgi:hypothetical protein
LSEVTQTGTPDWLQIDLDTTLAQAEVLFLTFKDLVGALDAEQSDNSERAISEELRSLLQNWTVKDAA